MELEHSGQHVFLEVLAKIAEEAEPDDALV
jgi:hypothetical protein